MISHPDGLCSMHVIRMTWFATVTHTYFLWLMQNVIRVMYHTFVSHLGYLSHYNGVIMCAIASQITSFTIVYWTVHSGANKKKPSKLRAIGLCAGNSPVTGEFPAQMASNAENVSIWWRHHGYALPFWSHWDGLACNRGMILVSLLNPTDTTIELSWRCFDSWMYGVGNWSAYHLDSWCGKQLRNCLQFETRICIMWYHAWTQAFYQNTQVIQRSNAKLLGPGHMLKCTLVNKGFITRLLIGLRLCCQPIKSQVWKSYFTNVDFNMEIS